MTIRAAVDPLTQLVGDSPGIAALRDQIRRLLQRHADSRRLPTVLLQGETGTGKGLVTLAMHATSARAGGPFVDINCAAIPETLLEAEMFGVERGAFTDARQSKPGLFQLAHRGTIFLDEIGLMPEALQVKLLKVIEERAVRRLGSTRSEVVDVWVVAATNDDLAAMVRAGRFRADLYHRLAVVTLSLPPLRERGGDILLLAEHFLARSCTDYGLPAKTLAPAAHEALRAYGWPGNVRELSNVMERVALLSESSLVTPEVLALPQLAPAESRAVRGETPTLREAMGDVERERVLEALVATHWNVSHAAARLGISRNTLRYRMEKLGVRQQTARPAGPAAAAGRPRPTRAETPGLPPPVAAPRERRRLTLLRAALVGPPDFNPPTEGRRALDLLSDKAQSFGGRVEERSTGGIVAIFGLEPVEDAPLRAMHAAMAIRNGVERLRRAGLTIASVKIALHVDSFLVASGTADPPIDLEARAHAWAFLESLLSPVPADGIIVSDTTLPFLKRRFDLVPAPGLKGHVGQGWCVMGRERTGLGRLGGRLAAFVGRQQELALLRSRFETAAHGQGQIVGIAGEAGIGKSRLLFEFRQALAEEPAAFLEGYCLSYGGTIPYLPVLDIVRALCGLTEADPADVAASKIGTTLADVGLDPSETAPYLLHLLGLTAGAERLATLGPEEIKARTFDTLNQLLSLLSARRPLVVQVEDLHWIDTVSDEYLAALAEMLAGARILLVATYRAGYQAAWLARSYAAQMGLPPLNPEHARRVVVPILGPGDADHRLVELILSKAEGNPFFLEELAWEIREQRDRPFTVPDTVHEVLLARIGRLPPEAKHLLQTAAVIGKDVPLSLLRAIAGLPEAELRQHLTHLKAAEFVRDRSPAPEVEYTFKHTLTHEVTYQSMGQESRRALHARILDAMEAIYGERLPEYVDRLAAHAFLGEVWDKALVHLRQAGAKAVMRSAHSEAVTCFARALVALQHLPEGQKRDEVAVDLHLSQANSLVPIGELSPIRHHLREAEGIAQALGDERRLGRVSSFLTQYFWLIGDHEQAVRHGRRALGIAERLSDLTLQVRTNLALGQTYHVLGDYRQAIEVLGRNVDALQGDTLGRRFGLVGLASVLSRAWLVWCLAELGEFAGALPRGEEAIRIAETVDHPYSVLAAYFGVGGLYLRRGEMDRAISVLERALDLCRVWDTQLRLWFVGVGPSLGHAYALAGRAAEAIPLLEQAMQQAAAMKMMFAQSLRVGWLAHAYLRAGRVGEAQRLGPVALELARRHGERGHEAWIHGIIGEIAVAADPPDVTAAEHAYREAITIANELGMRPRVAVGHLEMGRLYRRAGKDAQAAEHLAAAVAILRAKQMPLWLDEANAELSGLTAHSGEPSRRPAAQNSTTTTG